MAFEIYQQVIYIVINIGALLASLFSIDAFIKMRKQKKLFEARDMLVKVFLLFAIGIVLWTLAEFGWDLVYYMYDEMPAISFLDLLWFLGYWLFLAAFIYFNAHMLKKHHNMKKGLAMMGIAAVLASLLVYYVMITYTLKSTAPGIETLLYLFYAVADVILIVLCVGVYTFFRQVKGMSLPLALLAVGIAATFIADVIYGYALWTEVYGWASAFSDLFYAIGYWVWAGAFYLFSSRLKDEYSSEGD